MPQLPVHSVATVRPVNWQSASKAQHLPALASGSSTGRLRRLLYAHHRGPAHRGPVSATVPPSRAVISKPPLYDCATRDLKAQHAGVPSQPQHQRPRQAATSAGTQAQRWCGCSAAWQTRPPSWRWSLALYVMSGIVGCCSSA